MFGNFLPGSNRDRLDAAESLLKQGGTGQLLAMQLTDECN